MATTSWNEEVLQRLHAQFSQLKPVLLDVLERILLFDDYPEPSAELHTPCDDTIYENSEPIFNKNEQDRAMLFRSKEVSHKLNITVRVKADIHLNLPAPLNRDISAD